jgi:hypothetical protein
LKDPGAFQQHANALLLLLLPKSWRQQTAWGSQGSQQEQQQLRQQPALLLWPLRQRQPLLPLGQGFEPCWQRFLRACAAPLS